MNQWDFTGSRLKVKRANRHLDEFKSCISHWIASNPHRVTIEKNAEGGDDIVKFSITETMPENIPLIIGDAVHNLRSALDFIAVEIVRKSGLKFGRVYFPFAEDIQSLINSQSLCEISQASTAAQSIILNEIKPYKAGNPFIWSLNRLSNTDKHRLLITSISFAEFKVPIEYKNKIGHFIVAINSQESVDIPIPGRYSADVKIDINKTPTYQVFFDETQIEGLPRLHVPDLLGNCAELIENYITMFERI